MYSVPVQVISENSGKCNFNCGMWNLNNLLNFSALCEECTNDKQYTGLSINNQTVSYLSI